MKTTKNYPPIQRKFLSHFDGTFKSAVKFKQLAVLLNPSFCESYIYISGDRPSNTVTTRDTDGSTIRLCTDEEYNNCLNLAADLKRFILSHNPVSLKDLFNDGTIPMSLKPKHHFAGIANRACFIIDGELYHVPGLNLPEERKYGYMEQFNNYLNSL